MSHTISSRANVDLIDQKYAEWKKDPLSVDQNWAMFFEGFELGATQPAPPRGSSAAAGAPTEGSVDLSTHSRVLSLINAFRTLGHTAAWLDPLEDLPPNQPLLSLEHLGLHPSQLEEEVVADDYDKGGRMKLSDLVERLRRTYCDRIGFEIMHVQTPEVRNWLIKRIESRIDLEEPSKEKKKLALQWLAEAELFERFLHKKYVGQK